MRLRVLQRPQLSVGSEEGDNSRFSISLTGLLMALWGKGGGEVWALRNMERGATRQYP